MNKIMGALIAFGIVAAGIIGWTIARPSSAEQSAAVARQADARAQQLAADADIHRADAARAWLSVSAEAEALPDVIIGRRWLGLLSGVGLGVGVFVLAIGGAFAAVTWANVRARVVYPNRDGMMPLVLDRRLDGQLLIVDTGRALQSVTQIGLDGLPALSFAGGEASALQIASQAQAAGALFGLARRQADVPRTGQQLLASASQSAPVFASAQPGGTMRFVYVGGRGTGSGKAPEQEAPELADVRAIITGAKVRGLSRRAWLGAQLAGGGKMTRDRYDAAVHKLERANVIRRDGQSWQLALDEQAALGAFGLADAQPAGGMDDDGQEQE